MGKIAYVFSGQGDQYPGMGRDLAEKYPAAANIFARCDKIRPGTSTQCFEGTKEELKETKNTQPCLFALELAAAEVLSSKNIKPDAVAGFSLGEVAAATYSGMFDIETGFSLVCRRGQLMQQEAEQFDTAMAAVVKLTQVEVEELCGKYSDIYPVNFNCPGQITVSGLSTQMDSFVQDVKAAGGRAIPLNVKGAFHSPFMDRAALEFAKVLKTAEIKERHTVLYSNLSADVYTEDAVDLLSRQISSPVKWEEIIRKMIQRGTDTFVEIGPGKTLTNIIKKIDNNVKAVTVYDYLAEVESC